MRRLLAVYVPFKSDSLEISAPGSAGWLLIGGASLAPLVAAHLFAALLCFRNRRASS
jgi:hypothetical protein